MHDLITKLADFERDVAQRFEAGHIRGPVHLSGGNEKQLIQIFKKIRPTDWVFSTWRSHYHAMLHGIPPELVMEQIMEGRSMNLMFPEYRFFTSAIVGGICPIAVGVAACLAKESKNTLVWCFIGDMTSRTGIFHEASQYALRHDLPIRWVIEDNGYSCNTPTASVTTHKNMEIDAIRYHHERLYPHTGTGKWVTF